ncbi:MAG TPA: acyltransferase family protein, partial [Myxococcota bacterium]|nr:acyltransferase family protein [Myxococcota bacterium]
MQSGPPSPDAARLPSLDGMRGVAAVVVFLNHALNIFYPSLGGFVDRPGFPHAHLSVLRWLHVLPVAWLFNGPFAVSFFFVLSGFVLTRQVSAGSRPPTLQRLLLQRFLRLFPLVCVASTVGWLTLSYSQAGIDAVGALSGASSGDVFDPALAGQATLGALLTQILYGVWHNEAAPRLFDPVLWSIGTEFQGSMLLYVVLCSLRHLRAVAVRYIAAAALLVLFIGPFGLCFVAGMGLAERWAQHGRILPRDGAVAALAGPGL